VTVQPSLFDTPDDRPPCLVCNLQRVVWDREKCRIVPCPNCHDSDTGKPTGTQVIPY
jgi:hypothetical protein